MVSGLSFSRLLAELKKKVCPRTVINDYARALQIYIEIDLGLSFVRIRGRQIRQGRRRESLL